MDLLPAEVMRMICDRLDFRSTVALALTCQSMYQVVCDSGAMLAIRSSAWFRLQTNRRRVSCGKDQAFDVAFVYFDEVVCRNRGDPCFSLNVRTLVKKRSSTDWANLRLHYTYDGWKRIWTKSCFIFPFLPELVDSRHTILIAERDLENDRCKISLVVQAIDCHGNEAYDRADERNDYTLQLMRAEDGRSLRCVLVDENPRITMDENEIEGTKCSGNT